MAHIAYALSGQGRGHTSRAMAITAALRACNHTVTFCGGGTAQRILEEEGEQVIAVPALRQIMEANRIQYGKTIRCNSKILLQMPAVLDRLTAAFEAQQPDLLITDFEAFSARAAARMGLPILSFNHQQVVTEMEYDLPMAHWPAAALASAAIRWIAPSHPEHVLLTSFFFAPLTHPDRTTLVPPIIRPAVQARTPTHGEHVLVYYNHPDGMRHVLDTLRAVDTPFIVYCGDAPDDVTCDDDHITIKPPSLDGFLDDLAASRGVICTAGFTLISEALYLGKPLLVAPNHGIFEQTLNALFLQREGLGRAVLDRPLTPHDVKDFLKQRASYRARLSDYERCGNHQAIECIEDILMRTDSFSSSSRRSTFSASDAAGVAVQSPPESP
ncbi:MAG: glycosyl transferase [Bacteroidetes bacterium]|nr:glycosyl transferase [Bacteroidota bacterium]